MVKRILYLLVLYVVSGKSFAQTPEMMQNIDFDEDTTEMVTLNDIVESQEEISYREYLTNHFDQVWQRKKYFNIQYNRNTMSSDTWQSTGLTGDYAKDRFLPNFKTDWGVSIQLGKNFNLHKKPIANMVYFNLDYTWMDLDVNHYKAAEGTDKSYPQALYDSRNTYTDGSAKRYYPWNVEKYEAKYGMLLGPSITLSPFAAIKKTRLLHFLKFNFYYHIGYGASVLWPRCKDVNDLNQENQSDYDTNAFENYDKEPKFAWGHGLTTAIGFNLSWKAIGIGWERKKSRTDYKFVSSNFGSDKVKFNHTTTRVYLQIRY